MVSPASVPLAFRLYPTLRSATQLVACVSAKLRDVDVVRLLDPEHGEPFVSIGRLFHALHITPLRGIIRFGLVKPKFDQDLAGLAPFKDIWTPLAEARRIAEELGVLDELAGLLDWSTRHAWSVIDAEEQALLHNWQFPPNELAQESTSTVSMLETEFSAIVPLKKGRPHLRTQIPSSPSPPSTSQWDAVWSALIEWSVFAHENYLDGDETEPIASTSTAPDLSASFLWPVLTQAQLAMASTEDVTASAIRLGEDLVVRKSDRGYKAQMATVDGLAQLVLRLQDSQPPAPVSDAPPRRKQLVDAGIDASAVTAATAPIALADDGLRHRIAVLEKRLSDLSSAHRPSSSPLRPPASISLHFSGFGLIALAVYVTLPVLLALR